MTKSYQVNRAKIIRRTLGPFVAARYLAMRGWSIESSLWIIAGTTLREVVA